ARASLIKLAGNFMIAATIETLGEALAFVGKAGVDSASFVELLTATLFPAPVYRTYGALLAERKFQPPGFAVALGHKDVPLLLEAGKARHVPMPIANLLNARFHRLIARGEDELDWRAMGELAAEAAGLRPRASR